MLFKIYLHALLGVAIEDYEDSADVALLSNPRPGGGGY